MMPSLLHVPHAWIALAIEVASIVAFFVILLVAGHPRLAGRFAEHANWMRFIGAVHVGIDRIRREPKRALGVLFAAFVYQLSVVLAVWCAIHALGVDVPNAAVLAFVPAVASGQVLPISLSGLGIREGLLVLFLHPLGVPTGRAIGVGLLWYGMMLVVSLLGAPAFAVGTAAERARAGTGTRPDAMSAAGSETVAADSPAPLPLHRRLRGGRTPPRRPHALLVGGDRLRRDLLLRLLDDPEPQRCRQGGRVPPRASDHPAATRPRDLPRADDPVVGAARAPAHHRRQLLLRIAAFHRDRIGVMVYLYRRWTNDYPLWRNTLAIATAIALIGVRAFFPLMPPRLLPHSYHFVDTFAKDPRRSGRSTRVRSTRSRTSSRRCRACTARGRSGARALVPRVRHTWAKLLAAFYPVLTVTVIVVTANHYFLDAVGGFLVLGIGYVPARTFTRAGRGPVPARPSVPR